MPGFPGTAYSCAGSRSIHRPNTTHFPGLQVNRCLSIKGAEDTINKPFAFEISTIDDSMFFIADSEKVILHAPRGIEMNVFAGIWAA